MDRTEISEAAWHRLAPLLPGRDGTRGRSGDDNRRFLNAVVWMARNGGAWRDLPASLGHWNTVWRRFNRWSKAGVWQQLSDVLDESARDRLLFDALAEMAHGSAGSGDSSAVPEPTVLPADPVAHAAGR